LSYIVMLGTLVVWGAHFLARIEHEREWMHASVAVSEARLRTLVATIPDMIWLKDPDGVYLACNSAFEHFFGAKEVDIIGKTDYDFVSRELADFFRAKDRAAIALGGPSSNEEWLTIADTGQRILAETTKMPMLGSQGELLGVLGIARDVTQRHESDAAIRAAKAEAERLLDEANQSRLALQRALEDSRAATVALQLSEAALRDRNDFVETLLENAPIGFAVNTIADGRFMFVSRRFAETYGVPPGSLDGIDDFFDKVYPDPVQREQIRGRVMADIESGDAARMRWDDIEFTSRTGERRVISAANIPLPEQNHMISMVWEVTDRHRAEQALRESNALLHAFIMHSPIYAFIKSVTPTESRTVMASENYLDMIGIPGSEMAGKTMTELFPPDFAAKITADDWSTVAGGQVLHLDEKLNGRSYTTVKFPILVGGRSYLAGYTIDITEREQMMGELEQHRDNLEEMVAARTLELQAANKELEAFSYSVSHDLRAPLRAIAGFVALLKKHNYEAIDDKGQHYMDAIADAAVQMGRLIDDILTFSRIGRAEMSMSRVDMNALLDEVRNTLRPQIEGRRIEWKVGPLPEVTGERTMLSLVLQNLLANALKFTRTRDAAEIEIGTAVGGQNETVYYVRDNGVGFDMRHADKLFCLFQRLHPQEQFEGTGVGLANVQRIVQRHGGRVWAEGRVNEGATFYFALPKSES
jgi:PAS domain S-box-containing protein